MTLSVAKATLLLQMSVRPLQKPQSVTKTSEKMILAKYEYCAYLSAIVSMDYLIRSCYFSAFSACRT